MRLGAKWQPLAIWGAILIDKTSAFPWCHLCIPGGVGLPSGIGWAVGSSPAPPAVWVGHAAGMLYGI